MRLTFLIVFLALLPAIAAGQDLPSDFSTGPVIEAYGPVADVPGAAVLPPDSVFRVAFDTASAAEADQLNRTLVSAARFLNMHARAGIDPAQLHVAVVVHGGAVSDVAQPAPGENNINEALIADLLQHNVGIYVCGQSAAYYGVTTDDLLPGVVMSLSAMTAHAQLQQSGFTLNPF
ncbi:DsrE family protein [Hyphobacterium sp.]|uniref:DsrE family protein n=1 Tax=Hyphobacterium sp. TaxID=2004662 RepID=UPI003B52626A